MNVGYVNGKMEIEDISIDECVKIMDFITGEHSEKILPRPVIHDGNGKRIKNYTPSDFYLKFQEEIFEVVDQHYMRDWSGSTNIGIAEEIADIITVCISYLNAIGYDEKGRSEIFRRVNEKNEKRGYFKEAD